MPHQALICFMPTISFSLFRAALAPPFPAPSPSYKDKLHLKFPVILAEASLDETGRPRLRAWEQSHAGFAHKVAVDAEVLGLLAYCDPSEVCTGERGTACFVGAPSMRLAEYNTTLVWWCDSLVR